MRYDLKNADWLTKRRVSSIALILFVVSCIPIVFVLATSNGLYDFNGKLLGTDYSAFWSAGRLALDGQAGDAYDVALQGDHLKSQFDNPDVPVTAWLHPPTFYLIVTPLATLPYLLSLACWVGAGLLAYILMIRHLDPRGIALLLAIAFPPVLTNIPHGQTGMLFAAVLGAALICLERRPYLAGILIGLMTIKPHLGILIPFILLAGQHYRTIASAALTSLALIAVTIIWFGPHIWTDFYGSFEVSRGMILESGGAGWFKLQSVFAAMRIWGAPIEFAYLSHGSVAIGVALMVIAVWTKPIDLTLKFAALIAGSSLVSPYVYDYDLAMMAPAIGWMILYATRKGFLPYEKSALGFAILAPAFTRAFPESLYVPIGLIASLMLLSIVMRRILHEAAALDHPKDAIVQ